MDVTLVVNEFLPPVRSCPFRCLVRSAFRPLFVLKDPALLVTVVDVCACTLLLPVSLRACVLLTSDGVVLVDGRVLCSVTVCVCVVLPLVVETCAFLPLVRRSDVLPLVAAGICGLVFSLILIA